MGLDYSYLTYFPRERLWDALDGVAGISDLVGKPTRLTLADRIIRLPFTAWAGTDLRIRWDDPDPEWDFMTVLCFPPDPELEDYFSDREGGPDYVNGRISVGFIYLTVYRDLSARTYGETDPNLVLFQFTTAGTSMSILFTESLSIRKTFNALVQDHGGICCILDREMDGVLTWWKGREVDIEIGYARAPLKKIAGESGLGT